jgi:O-succinylbenzoate synthase
MAKAAVETAVLDAQLRTAGMALADYLGAVRTRVTVGVSLGIRDAVAELLADIATHVDLGYRRIKIKIEPGWDVDVVRAVREEFPDITLQVDANASYGRADVRLLRRLDDHDLAMIEQPFPADDLTGLAALASVLSTPLCLDESVTSAPAAADALIAGAGAILNIKPSRVGGYLEARRVHDVAVGLRAPVWCGGMLETGIGRAANLALAALPQFVLPSDISATARYWARDLTAPFELNDGQLMVPNGPGIGIEVDEDFLTEITVDHHCVTSA